MKSLQKAKAIAFRRNGLSYRQILEEIPVAKSTLALWLRSVGLSKRQRRQLSERQKAGQLRGAQARHLQRLERTKILAADAKAQIESLTAREKLLIGAVLYWAEGAKEKEGKWGSGIRFSNSDYRMVKIFQRWLLEIAKISLQDIIYEIYIHDSHKNRLAEVRKFWSEKLDIPVRSFDRIYFKRNKINTRRKNRGNGYYGLVRIRVRSSSTLYRRISGWIEGAIQNWGVV